MNNFSTAVICATIHASLPRSILAEGLHRKNTLARFGGTEANALYKCDYPFMSDNFYQPMPIIVQPKRVDDGDDGDDNLKCMTALATFLNIIN